jgi:thiamine transport system substrate-binding protein
MKTNYFFFLATIIFIVLLASCAPAAQPAQVVLTPTILPPTSVLSTQTTPESAAVEEPPAAEARTLTMMTHDSFSVSEAIVQAFEQAQGVSVKFLPAGDTGSAVSKAILAKEAPLADVFYGVDNTFLSRMLAEDVFIPYSSPLLAQVPDEFELDPQQRVLPVDYGDVCLNYAKAYFAEKELAPPQNLEDLLKPEYKGLLVVQNPAFSSPGLAFLLATIGHFGEDGYLDYWQKLVANDVLVVNDWNTAYYTEFSLSGGRRPIVVSYGSSPPAEVFFAEKTPTEAPTAVVTSAGSCFRQVEFVGILRGTRNLELAQQWIDFMLSPAFQEDMPLQMFVYPVNSQAKLPELFQEYAAIPSEPVLLPPELIAARREAWIQAWTEIVLR